MEYREANLRILQEKYPGLYLLLSRDSAELSRHPPFNLEATPSGVPTLSVGGLYLHSKRDPLREAQRLAQSLSEGSGPVVILGFGLGYTAEAAAERFPGRLILVLEKYPALIKTALEVRDLRPLLKQEKLIFVLGKGGDDQTPALESALALLGNSEGTQIALLANPALKRESPEWYERAEEQLRLWVTRDRVNRATLKKFGRRWVRNLSANLWAIRDMPGIAGLRGKARGLPILVLAAGPSLEDLSEILPQLSRRFILLAVDTSLRFCLERGVDPDFVVSVDPQYWNLRHLDNCSAPQSVLIAESAVYPGLLRMPFRASLLCSSLFPLGRFIEEKIGPKGTLGAGGSVATSAWDFARFLGPGDIYIAGLDLAFPRYRTHFRGARFEELFHGASYRFKPGESYSWEALRGGRPFWAEASHGGRVLTDQRLSLYQSWFQSRLEGRQEGRSFRVGREGLAIRGMECREAPDLLELPERREEIGQILDEALGALQGEFNAQREEREKAFQDAIGELLFSLREVGSLARRGYDLAAGGLRSGGNRGDTLSRLDEVSRAIQQSRGREASGFLFPDPQELEESIPRDLSELEHHLEYSKLLYQALEGAVDFNVRSLSEYL